MSGKVERITKSTCGRDELLSLQSESAVLTTTTLDEEENVKIDSQIRIDFCPSDIFIFTPLKEINVTWSEPLFSSRQSLRIPLERVEQNLKSGQVFTWGEYNVLYVAYNNASNLAKCTFKVCFLPVFFKHFL